MYRNNITYRAFYLCIIFTAIAGMRTVCVWILIIRNLGWGTNQAPGLWWENFLFWFHISFRIYGGVTPTDWIVSPCGSFDDIILSSVLSNRGILSSLYTRIKLLIPQRARVRWIARFLRNISSEYWTGLCQSAPGTISTLGIAAIRAASRPLDSNVVLWHVSSSLPALNWRWNFPSDKKTIILLKRSANGFVLRWWPF